MTAPHLKVEWVDPTGRTWDLTTGKQGVMLDVGQSDFDRSKIEHSYVRGGTQWAGSRVERAEPSLKVLVGDTLTGPEYYRLADDWWTVANSATAEGVLRVTRPDGVVRELRCRLRDTPSTQWDYDPGAGIQDVPGEAWLLTSPSPWWEGPEQTVTFTTGEIADAGSGRPFYGDRGYGWPLYIAGTSSSEDLFIENRGQGPQWLTWTLVGPLSSPRFGVEGGSLAYRGSIAAGEVVEVTTEPGRRAVMETVSGESRYGRVAGTYAPVPVASRVPLQIQAEGMTEESAIIVTAREQFARPF